jgi:hypothetical protein
MTNWATIADVFDLTGETVTDVDISKAQGILFLFAETTTDAIPNTSPKNLRLLKQATAYQTVWMAEHPDVFTNVDVTSYSQDGASNTQAHENAALLAPLARRCIKRLSWMRRPRSIRVGPALTGTISDFSGDRDSAVADDDRDWTSM